MTSPWILFEGWATVPQARGGQAQAVVLDRALHPCRLRRGQGARRVRHTPATAAFPVARPGFFGWPGSWLKSWLILCPLEVRAVGGEDDDAGAGADVRRHIRAAAVRQGRGLVGR